MRAFKGIFCDDISEFESSHPSLAVPSLWGSPSLQKYMRHPQGLARRHGVSDIQFSEFRPQPAHFMRQPVIDGRHYVALRKRFSAAKPCACRPSPSSVVLLPNRAWLTIRAAQS